MSELGIATPAGRVSASLHGTGACLVVLGHGAGSHRRHAFLVRMAEALAATGRRALLYNFPYAEAGRRRPDPQEVLEATTRAVGEYAKSLLHAERLVHGGRSMGGRIASQVVAQGAPADGLVFLAYPLHPPGRPERLRDEHLSKIGIPMLFVQGSRDAFARPDLLDAVLARLGSRATLHRVPEGDHSFAVPKRCSGSAEEVRAEIQRNVLGWLDARGL